MIRFQLLSPNEFRFQQEDLCYCPAPLPLPTTNPIKPQNFQEAFLQKMTPSALHTQKLTGIPASVTLAQAALESGWGKHAPGNNFFGMKGKGPAGSQWLRTIEFQKGKKIHTHAWFRKYHNPLQSFLDHARVISQGRYLRHAMQHTRSAEEFVKALQSGKFKYATDPHYAEKIMKIIRHYQLEKYDQKSTS